MQVDLKLEEDNLENSTLFDLTATMLTLQQKDIVREFLKHNSQVIGLDENDLGLTGTIAHDIDTQGVAPIKKRYRRFTPPLQKKINLQLHKWAGARYY